MLLIDCVEEFIYHCKVKNYTERTIKGYKNNNLAFIRYIEVEFEVNEIKDVKPLHLKTYFTHLNKVGRSASYINTILKSLRAFFKYCVEEGYVLEKLNPTLKVGWLRQENPVIVTFNDVEIAKMVQAFRPSTYMELRNKIIIMLLADTGIRVGELVEIEHINVLETNIKIKGKGRKERYVPISPLLKKNMMKYERVKELFFKDKILPYNNYFISFRCKPLTVEAVQRVVKIAGERAKVRKHIRCSPHTLRHYYAQKQLQLGMDVYSLSRLLGHNNINITKTYLQSIQDEAIVDNARFQSPLMNLNKNTRSDKNE